MIKILVILIVFVALSRAEGFENQLYDLEVVPDAVKTVTRIVNGQTAALDQFPHQALLLISTLQGTYQCGGSLISPLWVLSAAHCIIGARSGIVLLGAVNRNAMPIQRNAVQVHHMTSYNPSTLKDDISLIKLNEAITSSSNVHPIKLPTRIQASNTFASNVLTVSGFGLTTSNQISTSLQYTSVIGITNTECKSIYGSMIVSSILCTRGFPNPNQGSCSGDSGGPLIIGRGSNATVVGIVSFGAAQSCTQGFPQGFTRVGNYLDYIRSVTGLSIN